MDLQSEPPSHKWTQWIKLMFRCGQLSQVQEVSTHQEMGDERSKTGASEACMELGVRMEVKHEAEKGHAVLPLWSCEGGLMGRSWGEGAEDKNLI